ncbi:MAG TPA: GNAT family N-acetyltransferase, partial [Corynebacterium variabile]|nr:GNAT family N-acetyltransferase [Corynebacterium variabile]
MIDRHPGWPARTPKARCVAGQVQLRP